VKNCTCKRKTGLTALKGFSCTRVEVRDMYFIAKYLKRLLQ
jgi:hypothetical protein